MIDERELAKKVLNEETDNMRFLNRAFPYLNEEHLFETLQSLYPELNEVFIVNFDERDCNQVPLLKTKNLRSIKVYHSRSKYRYSGRTECEVDVKLRMVLAVIENGQVYIKSATLGNGYYNRKW